MNLLTQIHVKISAQLQIGTPMSIQNFPKISKIALINPFGEAKDTKNTKELFVLKFRNPRGYPERVLWMHS